MCGFLGQFSGQKIITCLDDLNRLLRLSDLRGPDLSQTYSNEKNVWFGFNRLSILDLSEAGSQPMHSNSKRYTLVFNGEIYNHRELRTRLKFKNWRGHSDSETILQCVEEYGFEKTLDLLDGMFAIAIYDHLEDSLLCARDFAGIKPFFYGWNGSDFIFASQYDQIVQHPEFRDNAIDEKVLRLYLEQHFMPAPFGLVKQTGQLEPGQWIKISSAGMKTGYYWQFPEYVEPEIFDEAEANRLIASSLSESVSSEMLSDVPLGAFLSGGIDSPLICHYASKHQGRKLKTFTIGFDSKVHNESDMARQYANLIGTDHHNEMMSADSAFSLFNEAMNCVREPMADFSVIPTFLVSKLARKQVTVSLSGDGGDELFFGYERFWSVAKNVKYQQMPWILKAFLYKGDQFLSGNKRINDVVLSKKQGNAHRGLHNRFDKEWINRVFPDLANVSTPENYNTYNYSNTRTVDKLIQAMRKAEFYGMMQKTLRKVDLASMGVSLEVRVPFLKKSFIETALKIDPMLSFGPNKKKQLLKNHLRNLYPKAPIDNIKRGFTIPLGKWFNEKNFLNYIREQFQQTNFIDRFSVSPTAVNQLISEHLKVRDHKWSLFTLLAIAKC